MASSKLGTNGSPVGRNTKILFLICFGYSLLHLGLMLDAFFTKRDNVAYALIVLHGMLLALYVGPKELGRWFKVYRASSRPGEFLVFLWGAALTFMSTLNHFQPQYRIPEGMLDTVMTLGIILIGSETSKLIHGWRNPCQPPGTERTDDAKPPL